jgi:hypothetical protein
MCREVGKAEKIPQTVEPWNCGVRIVFMYLLWYLVESPLRLDVLLSWKGR